MNTIESWIKTIRDEIVRIFKYSEIMFECMKQMADKQMEVQ